MQNKQLKPELPAAQPSTAQPSKSKKVFFYLSIGILAVVWFFLLVTNTIHIAQDIAASWALELVVLIGAALLLFTKKGGHEKRFILEASLFLAALLVFIAKIIIGGH